MYLFLFFFVCVFRLNTVFSFYLFCIVSFPNFHTIAENWVKQLLCVALPVTHPVIRVRGFWLPHWVTARRTSPVVSPRWPTYGAERWPWAAQPGYRLARTVQPCPPEWLLRCRSFLLCWRSLRNMQLGRGDFSRLQCAEVSVALPRGGFCMQWKRSHLHRAVSLLPRQRAPFLCPIEGSKG